MLDRFDMKTLSSVCSEEDLIKDNEHMRDLIVMKTLFDGLILNRLDDMKVFFLMIYFELRKMTL